MGYNICKFVKANCFAIGFCFFGKGVALFQVFLVCQKLRQNYNFLFALNSNFCSNSLSLVNIINPGKVFSEEKNWINKLILTTQIPKF